MRILSGIQPSGRLHIGNYFGMMKQAVELQKQGETFLFIADYHSLTTLPKPEQLRERVTEVAIDFLACGLDVEKTCFFRQSEVPQVCELTWLLNAVCPLGLLQRAHSYKDKIAKGFDASNGLFSYPVLMAADILIYQSNLVPVGKDQKQHLEITRDLAIKFNDRFGEIFTIPDGYIPESVAVIPGIDGQKMSKSYDNTIPIFGTEKEIRKVVMSIVTDSKGLNDSKDPDKCSIVGLYKLFANPEQVEEMNDKYRTGGYGYGHAKQALFESMWNYFEPMRKRRNELIANPDTVREILQKGAKKASAEAEKTMSKARQAVGLR
ncbi:MAG: tryptophan--tRNA ligase [Victivallaceae bacterium]|jgi:tryptophanyl-tRNA synthetase|nr:tryptophan--tRNA ligase [Victivallaceae bacterium]MDD3117047.1 tryptophan--tRNA ligase [Victivallaceae bacterium]MDD4317486.1 tryptophan--tRNA ligase [Victivallaceae bacterium]MDD5664373.1 tryptophan--tRNA ligase [Victivallaceae bacterium]NLK84007.1 tryptophan--tRNA ligase [Lentisphaerota bacterium]